MRARLQVYLGMNLQAVAWGSRARAEGVRGVALGFQV